MSQPLHTHRRKSAMDVGEIYFWTATINGWKHLYNLGYVVNLVREDTHPGMGDMKPKLKLTRMVGRVTNTSTDFGVRFLRVASFTVKNETNSQTGEVKTSAGLNISVNVGVVGNFRFNLFVPFVSSSNK